ncbi:dolichyl-phosphate-mannose-protein mannosyltransferase [Planomicrobium soli]|uniref:Dolichyl-phosphate-mannose-protein mannosyltransferase n=1 Tax=Planomicrobium soli TaxID=1176648 RepID=A0A2P8H3K0_9BACL|nr:glycosyltransferase family 39 protein [Planomicrobium soli]PSL40788.1 dolichyl-phosphate-mannose-protein mannosyltransferase [Planomicrobium soli]
MIFVLAFFIFQITITYIIKDHIPAGEAFGIILVLTSIVAISLYLYRSLEKEWLLLIFGGFAVRVLVLFIDLYVPSLPIFSSGTDTEYFHEVSVAIANGLMPLSEGATAYVPFLSALYYLVGDQRPYVQFINVAFWVFSAMYLLKTLRFLEIDKKLIFLAMGVFTVMPNSIFMSSILLRESIIIFFISISLYHFIKWFADGKFPDFLLSVILAVMSMVFHSGMIGFVVAYVLAFLFLSQKKSKKAGQSFLYLIFFALLVFIMSQNTELFLSKFEGLTEEGVEISGIGGSMYLASFNGLSGIAAILVAPIKMFYFMFSPLPIDWRGMGDIVSFLFDSSVYLFLIGATIFGLVKSDMPLRNKVFIVMFLAVTVVVYSYGTQSAGTAMRHRNKMIPLLLITFAIANSKQLVKLTDKRWRPKEGEKAT